MARIARQYGRVLIYVLPLLAIAAFFVLQPHQAEGGTPYSDPFWTHTSSYPECSPCSSCGCPSAPEFTREGVSARTGELVVDFPLFSFPGRTEPLVFSLRWRSMVSGRTQVGLGMIPSWETTAEKVILNHGNPNGSGGHEVIIRRPSGLMETYDWDGSAYSAATCLVTDTLTTNGSAYYVLTKKTGEVLTFDATGMPDTYEDRNSVTVDSTTTPRASCSRSPTRGAAARLQVAHRRGAGQFARSPSQH